MRGNEQGGTVSVIYPLRIGAGANSQYLVENVFKVLKFLFSSSTPSEDITSHSYPSFFYS